MKTQTTKFLYANFNQKFHGMLCRTCFVPLLNESISMTPILAKSLWVVHEILCCCFLFSLFIVTAQAAILDGQFVKKRDIILEQLHLQIILIEPDYILFSIS